MLIDLHTHSTESDGTFTPEEIIDTACKNELDTIALCDHDTTSGLQRFLRKARQMGITGVPGIEISSNVKLGHCHILGLNVPLGFQPLEDILNQYRMSRSTRNIQIISKLNLLGIQIHIDELKGIALGEVVGRPHIARLLVQKKFAVSIDDAFDRFLKKGAVAYVERFRLEPEEAVKLLRDCDATVVLAHPGMLKIPENDLFPFIKRLVNMGLDGIELYTPHNTDEQIELFSRVAKMFNLKCSGGSDFHGDNKPGHKLGYYRENEIIPPVVRNLLI
jgi:predicted metal-dependent phosphoesterase TrpH